MKRVSINNVTEFNSSRRKNNYTSNTGKKWGIRKEDKIRRGTLHSFFTEREESAKLRMY